MPITVEPKGPKPPLAGLMKVQVLWQSVGFARIFTAANVLHARWSDNVNHPIADLTAYAAEFNSLWFAQIIPNISSAWETIGIVVTSLGGDGLQGSDSTVHVGGTATPALPPQVAVALSWKAAFSWRGGRPRTYLPGVPTSAANGNGSAQLLSAYTSVLRGNANTLRTAMDAFVISGATGSIGFPSYFTRGAFRPVPLFFPFQDVVVHDRLDSQRRRSGKESTFAID